MTAATPGRAHLGPAVERFDEWCDQQLDILRGNVAADRIFRAASELGDFSLIWHIVAAARALGPKRDSTEALLFAALIGAESLVVNQGVKRLFSRTRPTESGDPRFAVRTPTTSSFPSGHASAAAFAVALLLPRCHPLMKPVLVALGATVAVSRAYVRIHHASDVVAGIATGLALAAVVRRVLR